MTIKNIDVTMILPMAVTITNPVDTPSAQLKTNSDRQAENPTHKNILMDHIFTISNTRNTIGIHQFLLILLLERSRVSHPLPVAKGPFGIIKLIIQVLRHIRNIRKEEENLMDEQNPTLLVPETTKFIPE